MKLGFLFSGLLLYISSFAQFEPSELFFKEDWNNLPPYDIMTPYTVSQSDVMNPELIQRLYGVGQDSIKKRHHGTDKDPFYIFSGFCDGNWALSLSHKFYYADLSGNANIRCRMMNSGFRELHVIIKLADGTWLLSDQAEGASSVWKIHDYIIKDIKWSLLDIKTIVEGNRVDNPDLRKVDEIGFTDLMNGGRSAACSRVDWIEVYANSVKR
jgi:hypothetical protein